MYRALRLWAWDLRTLPLYGKPMWRVSKAQKRVRR